MGKVEFRGECASVSMHAIAAIMAVATSTSALQLPPLRPSRSDVNGVTAQILTASACTAVLDTYRLMHREPSFAGVVDLARSPLSILAGGDHESAQLATIMNSLHDHEFALFATVFVIGHYLGQLRINGPPTDPSDRRRQRMADDNYSNRFRR